MMTSGRPDQSQDLSKQLLSYGLVPWARPLPSRVGLCTTAHGSPTPWTGIPDHLQPFLGMCPRGAKMPGASPQSHDASGWGSSKLEHHHGGIMSGLIPLAIVESARFILNPMGGQHPPPPVSTRGGFPTQKVNKYVHPEVPTSELAQPLWHRPQLAHGLVWAP